MRIVLMAAIAALLTACSGATDVNPGGSWMSAMITGALVEEHHGDARFTLHEQSLYGDHYQCQIVSEDNASSSRYSKLHLSMSTRGMPPAGTYPIVIYPGGVVLPFDGFIGNYMSARIDSEEGETIEDQLGFEARSGEVRITRADEERLEGTFAFTGRLNGRTFIRGGRIVSAPPGVQVDSIIRVEGSFVAVRDRSEPRQAK